jgi:hypothetical protein
MWRALVALLLLGACGRAPGADEDATAGQALEAAARNLGIIADPRDAAGVYAAGEDRACLTRTAGDRYRIGVSIDYGEGQRCIANGSARGTATLDADLGQDCRLPIARDADRLLFPARMPAACARLCQGRATFDALAIDRLSEAGGEAARLRGADGKLLCAD